MFRKRLPLPPKIITILLVFCSLLFLLVIWAGYSLNRSLLSFRQLQNADFVVAEKNARQAILAPQILSTITLGKSDTIEAWKTSLEIVPQMVKAHAQWQNLAINIFKPHPDPLLADFAQTINQLDQQITSLSQQTQNSLFLKNLPINKRLQTSKEVMRDLSSGLSLLTQQEHQVIIVLQNTDEIRASGGFMGSYARLGIDDTGIKNLQIQDIYEPAGQFVGQVEAPPGVKEYLSGGNGLKLPDANWAADFPSAAKQILSFLALGGEHNVDSLITLNVEVIESILNLTGGIFLPDYGVTVTPDNLAEIARADRSQFFAGSKQKTQFLTTLFDHLKLKIEQLTLEQQLALGQVLMSSLQNKNIQIYSSDHSLQSLVSKYSWDGALVRAEDQFFLATVESNVGINKANKKIFRQTEISLGQTKTQVKINFENKNTTQLDYLNYHRILVSPETKVEQIFLDGHLIDKVDQNIITTHAGHNFNQVGFLVPVATGQTAILEFDLIKEGSCQSNHCQLKIFKQSGIPPIPHTIKFNNQQKSIILEKDEVISF